MIAYFLSEVGAVTAVALVVGAGLPALYSFGIRSLSSGVSDTAPPPTSNRILAFFIFGLVLLVVLFGLLVILSSGLGAKVELNGFIPTFVSK
ncbi:hypothetical protein [Dermatophilus congolensis]|uniref:Uncharacterized protein n=1 Tax=Dermatophilus congolensis TaxID=1863 RepID=A0AA46BPU3_9MICO|nr:hypothetical protein [Dermatophilus congolensis]MBO3143745.1 hypothetical protein [Dermatophilus congolensis]MBO3152736.1 hypothetical protein [Dermatophilus congolensis]MBO3160253.1 hypothetical protein [Dermatophilus congolensis]MBO3164021.1 hypothetical protein [Dermatophilus congolensis]MBO3177566.1 hypothetical protein [Dermatophilus congolensis]